VGHVASGVGIEILPKTVDTLPGNDSDQRAFCNQGANRDALRVNGEADRQELRNEKATRQQGGLFFKGE
jgi:hypothetical protein